MHRRHQRCTERERERERERVLNWRKMTGFVSIGLDAGDGYPAAELLSVSN
jgi:hypothetical protein